MEQIKKPLGKGLSILILAIVLVLVLVGYFFFILKPLLVEINDVQSEIIQTSSSLEGLRTQQAKYVQMKQTLQEAAESGIVVARFDNEAVLLEAMNTVMIGASTYEIGSNLEAGEEQKVVRRTYSINFTCASIEKAEQLIEGLSKIPYRNQIKALSLRTADEMPETSSNIWGSSIGGDLVITFFEGL